MSSISVKQRTDERKLYTAVTRQLHLSLLLPFLVEIGTRLRGLFVGFFHGLRLRGSDGGFFGGVPRLLNRLTAEPLPALLLRNPFEFLRRRPRSLLVDPLPLAASISALIAQSLHIKNLLQSNSRVKKTIRVEIIYSIPLSLAMEDLRRGD